MKYQERKSLREIGVHDYYSGGLFIKKGKARYYWAFRDFEIIAEEEPYVEWQEIPKYLYDALNKFEDKEEEEKC